MMKSIAKTRGKTDLVMESSTGTRDIGKHAWTMELFWDVPEGFESHFTNADARNGEGSIEWDIPKLEMTEHIGIWTKCGCLYDYDGIMGYLPPEAIELLESVGITVGPYHRP